MRDDKKEAEAMLELVKMAREDKEDGRVIEEFVDELSLINFIEAYEDLDKIQLWDFLNYNNYIKTMKE